MLSIAAPAAYPPPNAVAFRVPSTASGATKLWKYQGGNTGGGGTFCALVPAEAAFTGGNILIANPAFAFIRIAAIAVAPSAIENDGFTPVDGSGNAVPWTVLSGGPWVVPTAKYLAPGSYLYRPGILKVPFTAASITRSDTASYPPFVMIRVYALDPIYSGSGTPNQVIAQRAAYGPGKRTWNGFFKSGNFVASNQTGLTSPSAGYNPVLGVEFSHTGVIVKSFADVGDSTTQGAKSQVTLASTTTTAAVSASISIPVTSATGIVSGQTIFASGIPITSSVTVSSISGNTVTASTAVTLASGVAISFDWLHDYNGPLAQWQDTVSTLTRPVYCFNLGYQGWTVEQFLNAADQWLSTGPAPTGVIIQPWSTNSTLISTQSAMDADYIRARNFALKCQRSGMVAILKTPKPCALTLAPDNIRKGIVARVKADTFPFVDSDGAVSDGGSPANLQSQYNSGDGVHCNNAGYGNEATTAYAPVLANYI